MSNPPIRTRTYNRMMKQISMPPPVGLAKVSIIGAGQVGMATAFSLLSMDVCSELALVDSRKGVVEGEKLDLLHGQAFLGRRCNVAADTNYDIIKDSKVVIVTAGVRQKDDETRLDLVQKNADILKAIVPGLVRNSPDAVIIVVTDPCDVMAWITWKLSGLPKYRIMSSGTMLDTSRFRHLIAEQFDVAPHSVHGYIIGEHGDSSVAVWSSVNVAGTMLTDLCPTAGESPDVDAEDWQELHRKVIDSGYEIIRLKGYTNWSIGMMCSRLVDCILQNQQTVLTVGTMPDGWNGIRDDLFISVPCVVGKHGISHIVSMTLSAAEAERFQRSAKMLRSAIDRIVL